MVFKNVPGVTPPNPRSGLRGKGKGRGEASLQTGKGRSASWLFGGIDAPACMA